MDKTALSLKIDDDIKAKPARKRRTKSENFIRNSSMDSGYDEQVVFRIGD